MTFENVCVGIIITAILFLVTWLYGRLVDLFESGGEYDVGLCWSWILSTMGFGGCLTILLYVSGII